MNSIMLECWPCKRCLSKPWKLSYWQFTWFDFRQFIRSKHNFVWEINDNVKWKFPKLYKTKVFSWFINLLWELPNWGE